MSLRQTKTKKPNPSNEATAAQAPEDQADSLAGAGSLRSAAQGQGTAVVMDVDEVLQASLLRILPEDGQWENYGDASYVPHGGVQLKREGADTVRLLEFFEVDKFYMLQDGVVSLSDVVGPDGAFTRGAKSTLSSDGWGPKGPVIHYAGDEKESWKIDLDDARFQTLDPELQDRLLRDALVGITQRSGYLDLRAEFGEVERGLASVQEWAEQHPLDGAECLRDVETVLVAPVRRKDLKNTLEFERWVDLKAENYLAGLGAANCTESDPETDSEWLKRSAYEQKWASKIEPVAEWIRSSGTSLSPDEAKDVAIGVGLLEVAQQAQKEGMIPKDANLVEATIDAMRKGEGWTGIRCGVECERFKAEPDRFKRFETVSAWIEPVLAKAYEDLTAPCYKGGWGMLNQVERKHPVAWGARAIYSGPRKEPRELNRKVAKGAKKGGGAYVSIDIPFDRHEMLNGHMEQRKALATWINDLGLPALKEELVSRYITQDSQEVVTIENPDFCLMASPKRSGGYLYLAAWLKAGEGIENADAAEWSGKGPRPAIGDTVINRGFGEGVVIADFVEDGFYGVRVLIDDPKFAKRQAEKGNLKIVWSFGAELAFPARR